MGGGESVEVGRRGTGWGEVGAKGSPPEATQPPPPPPPGCCLHRHIPPPPPHLAGRALSCGQHAEEEVQLAGEAELNVGLGLVCKD